jgi:pilus assembly protein CpaF
LKKSEMLFFIMETLLTRLGDRAREIALSGNLGVEAAVTQTLDEMAKLEGVYAEDELVTRTFAGLKGLGALEPFLADSEIEELWMNEPNRLFVSKRGETIIHHLEFSAEQIEVALERMLRSIGRRIDRKTPFVDAPLDDGSRLHAVIPDVTRKHISFNIRRYVENSATLESLLARGIISQVQKLALEDALVQGKTILVSGATAAGKTTLLGALLRSLPKTVRIVSVEDTFEINIPNPDWVAMQTRPSSLEGNGEIDMRRLIREALRMRPGRLVIGEVRGAEAIDLLVALNSGVPAICTVHSNSAEHALTKLMTLPLLSGIQMPLDFVKLVIGSSVGLIAHCELDAFGSRRVGELLSVSWQNGEVLTRHVS